MCQLYHVHISFGFPDPSKAFVITQMLKGYGKVGFRLDSQLPILLGLIQAAAGVTNSPENAALFKAMCSLAFYALLRVGEINVVSSNKSDVPLQLDQLTQLVDINNKVVALKLYFRNYKHSYNRPTFSLTISCHANFCPVGIMLEYLNIPGHQPGPLFVSSGVKTCPEKCLLISFLRPLFIVI